MRSPRLAHRVTGLIGLGWRDLPRSFSETEVAGLALSPRITWWAKDIKDTHTAGPQSRFLGSFSLTFVSCRFFLFGTDQK